MLLSMLLIILGLRLIKFSVDIRRIPHITCPNLNFKRLDRITNILDRQIEILKGLENEIQEYVNGGQV